MGQKPTHPVKTRMLRLPLIHLIWNARCKKRSYKNKKLTYTHTHNFFLPRSLYTIIQDRQSWKTLLSSICVFKHQIHRTQPWSWIWNLVSGIWNLAARAKLEQGRLWQEEFSAAIPDPDGWKTINEREGNCAPHRTICVISSCQSTATSRGRQAGETLHTARPILAAHPLFCTYLYLHIFSFFHIFVFLHICVFTYLYLHIFEFSHICICTYLFFFLSHICTRPLCTYLYIHDIDNHCCSHFLTGSSRIDSRSHRCHNSSFPHPEPQNIWSNLQCP